MTESKITTRKKARSSKSAKIAKHAIKKHTTDAVKRTAPKRESKKSKLSIKKRIGLIIGYLALVFISFYVVEIIVNLFVAALMALNLSFIFMISDAVLQFIMALLVYSLTFVLAVVLAKFMFKAKTTLQDVGLSQRLPRWRDIGLAPVMFIVYMFVSGIFIQIINAMYPDLINLNQHQAIGFNHVTTRAEMIAAYVTLTILAPFAEELLFRGFLYGKLRKYIPALGTILLTALLFSILHLVGVTPDGHIQLQWAVVFDVFVLAIGLGVLREYTKSIWAGVLLHAIKNSIAFFMLFIAPLIGISLPGVM